jgi:hypothetical protein
MAGGRGALFREVGQSGFDLAWGWTCGVLYPYTVFNHVSGPRCSSLSHEPRGGTLRDGWVGLYRR